ncbi:PilC/PilY family type IV pilus protein [uncultured Aquitalea sp.]|uniref:pilus assembly protein n=1 Tax=uncultured Aquitalea sp. TaxID=540272 RepID=UPI0025D954A7|nr:PilC/PilY family type IV pilus protein [uncultured Aquitalea sp.]
MKIFKQLSRIVTGATMLLTALHASAAVTIATSPLAGVGGRYGPNVLLGLSVEFPTAGEAYTNRTFNTTEMANDHRGYFDQYKCYSYDSTNGYFKPVALVNNKTNRTCSSGYWSGSLLNWATMSAIDIFRQTLTGGNRALGTAGTSADYTSGDTATLTILRRARIVSGQNQGYGFNGSRVLTTNASTLTPYSSYSQLKFTSLNWGLTVAGSNDGSNWTTLDSFNVMVQVCKSVSGITASGYTTLGLTSKYNNGIEDNCTAYGSNYKPEGLIQQRGADMRFSAFGYLIDANYMRNGGVLRARMKYPGISSSTTSATNTSTTYTLGAEWSSVDGTFVVNPDTNDASNSGVTNSGVVNYVNKFGDGNGYKTYDPAAELYYAALRYFRKIGNYSDYTSNLTTAMKDNFPVITDWDDPIINACQKNFIIYIGDTNTHGDVDLPGSGWTASGNQTSVTPPTDDPASNMSTPPVSVSGSGVVAWVNAIGSQEGVNNLATTNTGSTNSPPYIAGLAYWANVTDLRSDLFGNQTVSAFMIDVVENGNAKTQTSNAFYLAAKYGGFTDSNNSQTPDVRSEWTSDAAGATSIAAYPNGTPSNFAQANNPSKMTTALQQAFANITAATDPTMAGLSTTGKGSQVFSSAYVFQSSFDSTDWHGDLIAYQIVQTSSTTAPTLVQDATHGWRAKSTLETQLNGTSGVANRNVLTYDLTSRSGAAFNTTWFNALSGSATQKTLLNSTDSQGANRVNYLRGDKTNEASGSSPRFRARNYRLGDIVDSTPIYVPAPTSSLSSCAYAANSTNQSSDQTAIYGRPNMVMVAANDGFLHGFDMTGTERFAYLPAGTYANLVNLTSTSYAHRYINDGTPKVGEVCFVQSPSTGQTLTNLEAHTVVVGNTGMGGSGIYALDVTRPDSMSSSNVLWEFTSTDDSRLGVTIGEPQIVRLQNGRPAVLLANGYNNSASGGGASLFILYLDKKIGDAWQLNTNYFRIDLPDQTGQTITPNGLSTPFAADVNGDGKVDYAYAGDINGNLWKINLTSATYSGYTSQLLFTAYGLKSNDTALDVRQPITAQPVVTRDATKGYMVLFGTGMFLSDSDRTESTQSLYGIRDTGTAVGNTLTGSLVKQTIGTTVSGTSGGTYVTTSTNTLGSTNNGWYMPLTTNERVIAAPELRNRATVRFTSIIPDTTGCSNGGDTWLTDVSIFNGAMTTYAVYDTNGDGNIDGSDAQASRFKPSTSSGISSSKALRLVDQNGIEWVCEAGSGGLGTCKRVNSSTSGSGRLAWREIIQSW